MPETNYTARNVSLKSEDWRIVAELANDLFDGNMSQALRYIVRHYSYTRQPMHITADADGGNVIIITGTDGTDGAK